MCNQCDKQGEAVTTVEFYQVFLEQGITILEMARQLPDKNTDFIAKKIRLFRNEYENLNDIAVIGNSIYEHAMDVPQELRDANPKEYEQMVRSEQLRQEMNTFLEEVL